jgi:CHAD domain-containing protein
VRNDLTPRAVVRDNVSLLFRVWDGARDGKVESVHQARIATRRLRASLEVLGAGADVIKLCRSLGRNFGRVRELDAAHELMADFASTVPAAAAVLGIVGSEIDARRLRARRRLVKALDAITPRPLAHVGARRYASALKFWTDWHEGLIAAVSARTRALRRAVDDAPMVYMPNRLHRVRIALKKLRYTLEIAAATGTSIDRRAMRDATKMQDLLGRMHDLQTTRKLIRRMPMAGGRMSDERKLLDAVMTSECASLHAKYLSRRERLGGICDYAASLIISRPVARAGRVVLRALPAVAIAALPVVMRRLAAGPAPEANTT